MPREADFGMPPNNLYMAFLFFKQKTAYEMRISDWSSDVCSSDLLPGVQRRPGRGDNPVLRSLRRIDVRHDQIQPRAGRSEERRVGKECVSTCRFRWSPNH